MHNNLPTVVTSNWTERETALYHSRIASRLKGEVHVNEISVEALGTIMEGGRARKL